MGGKKSKSYDESSDYRSINHFQNQNYNSNNLGLNNQMNRNNQSRHNHGHHNNWNHRMNHHHNHHNHRNHHYNHHHDHHHQHQHNNQNHHNQNFNHNNYNPNDQMENQFSNQYDNNNVLNELTSFRSEDYPQDPFQHPDPRYLHQNGPYGPRPVMNPNIDRMNQFRRMRRRPRRRLRRRRAFDPFVEGEFLAENNPEFFVDPHRPRYLTDKEVKFMKNTYWNPESERAPYSHSENSIQSSERNYSHSEQTDMSVPKSPLENIKPPKLKKLNIKPYNKVEIPNINFDHTEPEKKVIYQKNNILSRYNKKKYPTTFYAKPVRPKMPSNEFHFKVFNNRKNPLNTAKYMISSIRVPKNLNNEVTIKVDQ